MPMEKLSRRQVLEIYAAEGTLQQIGERFNITASHAGYIKRGMSHGAVTGAQPAASTRKVLSADLIQQIKAHKGTVRAASIELDVAGTTIKKYRGRTGPRACATQSRDSAGRFVNTKEGLRCL